MLKSVLLAGLASVFSHCRHRQRNGKKFALPAKEHIPFNYMSPDGKLEGFDLDIANALCEAMEAKCTIVANDWDGMIPGLQANKFDAVIASMAITEEREKQIAFSERYYTTPLAVVVPKDRISLRSIPPHLMERRWAHRPAPPRAIMPTTSTARPEPM